MVVPVPVELPEDLGEGDEETDPGVGLLAAAEAVAREVDGRDAIDA